LAFAPDSRTLAGTVGVLGRSESGAVDRLQPQVVFWDAATGEQRTILTAPPGSLVSLAFSPDGKTLATGGVGVVLLWDVADEVTGR
jgi:WD40 repeat protein